MSQGHPQEIEDIAKSLQVFQLAAGELVNLDGRETHYTRDGGISRIEYVGYSEDVNELRDTNRQIRGNLDSELAAQGLVYVDYRGLREMSPTSFCPVVWILLPNSPASSQPTCWDRVIIKPVVPPRGHWQHDTVAQQVVLTSFQFQSWVWRLRAWSLSNMHVAMYRRRDGEQEDQREQRELWEEDDVGLRVPLDAVPVAVAGRNAPGFDVHWTREIHAPPAVYPGQEGRRLTATMMQQLLGRLVLSGKDQVVCKTYSVDEIRLGELLGPHLIGPPRVKGTQPETPSVKHLADNINRLLTAEVKLLTTRGVELCSMGSWLGEVVSLCRARVERMNDIYMLDARNNTGIRSRDGDEFELVFGEYCMTLRDLVLLYDTLTQTPFRNEMMIPQLRAVDSALTQIRTLLCVSAVNLWTIFVGRGNDMYSEDLSPLLDRCPVPVCPCGMLTRVGLPIRSGRKPDEWSGLPDGLWNQYSYVVTINHGIRRYAGSDLDGATHPFTDAALQTVELELGNIMASDHVANDKLIRRAIARDMRLIHAARRECPQYTPAMDQRWISRSLMYEKKNPWCMLWCDLSPVVGDELIRREDGTAVRPKYIGEDGSVRVNADGNVVKGKNVGHRFVGFNFGSLAGENMTGV